MRVDTRYFHTMQPSWLAQGAGRVAGSGLSGNARRAWRLMRQQGSQEHCPGAWKKTAIQGSRPTGAPDLISRCLMRTGRTRSGAATLPTSKPGIAGPTWPPYDLYSTKLVDWAIADRMDTALVSHALDQALTSRQPARKIITRSIQFINTRYTSSPHTARAIRWYGRWAVPVRVSITPYRNHSTPCLKRTDPHPALTGHRPSPPACI